MPFLLLTKHIVVLESHSITSASVLLWGRLDGENLTSERGNIAPRQGYLQCEFLKLSQPQERQMAFQISGYLAFVYQ